ncbi:MAG TPA: hypothetical protein VME69_16260 [Methylocella sp.]|nr:hypothetical protein [Methylocella sp.]
MAPSEMESQITRTLTEVLKERLIELESFVMAGKASDDTIRRLDFVRMLLQKFEAKAVESGDPERREWPDKSKA